MTQTSAKPRVMFSDMTLDEQTHVPSSITKGLSMMPSRIRRSKRIPIPKNLFRSASELQLCLDEQVANERDYIFYERLVEGIRHTQRNSRDIGLCFDNQRCLAHIMETRHNDDGSNLESRIRSSVRHLQRTIASEDLTKLMMSGQGSDRTSSLYYSEDPPNDDVFIFQLEL